MQESVGIPGDVRTDQVWFIHWTKMFSPFIWYQPLPLGAFRAWLHHARRLNYSAGTAGWLTWILQQSFKVFLLSLSQAEYLLFLLA
jgi:hypothetical protein